MRFASPRFRHAPSLPVLFCCLAVLGSLSLHAGAREAQAQIRASEPATLTQTIDGTEFRIDYHRPRTRGRSPLFGIDAVVWEHVWTPGANWATKIAFQKPIEFQGVPIPAGIYSIWIDMDDEMMPKELFFEPDTLIFHTMPPPPADDQFRFPLVMENDAAFTELLTWDFQDISSTGGVLALRWGTHRMVWDVKVEPSQRTVVTPEEAAPVTGEFQVVFVDPETDEESPPFSIRIFHDDAGILHADLEGVPPTPDGSEAWMNGLDMWLLPAGAEGWFIPGESYVPGELRETWEGYFFEFDLADGASPGFIARDDLDQLFMRGVRVR